MTEFSFFANTDLSRYASHQMRIIPAEPLWKRAPTHDAEGHPVSDFMMLIPKLGKRPQQQIRQTLQHLQDVINHYRHDILFIDLNLRLNILWISVKPVPGICLELPAAIQSRIPEALLIAQPPRGQ
jgi:hypothetical protein